MEAVIIAAITACVPATVTIITSRSSRKEVEKQSRRSNILSLITIDKVNVLEGKLPENQVAIHDQYDEYRGMGGNSFICKKVSEYDKWLDDVNKRKESDMGGCGKGKKKK